MRALILHRCPVRQQGIEMLKGDVCDHCGRIGDSKPGCDVTEGKWGCVLDRDHDGPHRNVEGLCIGPMVACYVPPGQTMYEVIWEWLAENNPAALELCPYKVRR